MITMKNIITIIENKFHLANVCSWDFTGWQIKAKNNINKILVCLDITNLVLEYALINNIELIICHHPLIFANDINHPSISTWKKQLYQRIKDNNINVYVMHTNFDNGDEGMNVLIAQGLNLENIKFLNEDKLAISGNWTNSLDLNDIIKKFKTYFNISHCQLIGKITKKISNIVLACGAAAGNVISTLPKKTELFISGEMKWNHVIEAQDCNINVLLVGHYMEQKFVDYVHDFLYPIFKEKLKIIKYKYSQPLITI